MILSNKEDIWATPFYKLTKNTAKKTMTKLQTRNQINGKANPLIK